MNSKPVPGNLIAATHNLWNASSDINWIVGRLGVKTSATTYDIDVVGRAGIVYVSLGNDGGLGQATALDAVGVAKTGWQLVRMRRENGSLVIREAEQYAGGSGGGGGGATNLDALTDVTLSAPSNGQVLAYDSATGQWKNSSAGGGGAIYTAGEAIDIDVSNVISVKRHAAGAVGVTSGALSINIGNGISIESNALVLNLSSVPGLEFGSGADAGKVQVKITDGIQRTAAGIGVKVTPNVGLDVDSTGVSVDVTDIIDTAFGLTEAANKIRISLDTNTGLNFGGSGGLKLGTPSTLAYNSTNSVTTATHSHAITSSSDVGTTPAQALLSSTGAGGLTLGPLTLYGNLAFAGGNRSITASNSLTITPTTDLILDPAGLILAPNAQDIRTVTINDLPTGIDGFRIWNRYANYTQLTIGAIKADELYVRVFVADETRIDRGEEFWSKSFGIVQEDFTLPAIGSTVDVWFEDAPAAVTFNLFANGDYLLMRTIDWGTGLVVQKVWWQVTAAKLAQETSNPVVPGSIDRQKWRIKRLSGGFDGILIKRGALMLDTGVVGQGWVHLSALSQDGGPFIQVGAMTSTDATGPSFTNYARFGRLNGTVDYGSSPAAYGVVAGYGSSGIGTTPSGGFSGFTADNLTGLRLFNTSILMYSGGVLGTSITNQSGIRLLQDTVLDANPNRYIEWFSTLSPIADANRRGTIRSAQDAGRSGMQIYSLGGSAAEAYIEVGAEGNGKSVSLQFSTNSQTATFVNTTILAASGTLSITQSGSNSIADFNTTSSGSYMRWLLSSVTKAYVGLASSTDHLITGSASGDFVLRAVNQKIIFSGDNGTSPHVIIGATGRVGIGATAPALTANASSKAVHVYQNDTNGAGFRAQSSNANIELQVGNAFGRLYSATATPFYLYTNDLIRLAITSAGDVGIGTTTPGIDVLGTTDIVNTGVGPVLQIDGTNYPHLVLRGGLEPAIDLIATGGTANQRWLRIATGYGGYTGFTLMNDGGSPTFNVLTLVHATGAVGFNTTATPTWQMEIEATDNHLVRATNFGISRVHYAGRRANGTQSAPSAIASGDPLMTLTGLGYTSGGWAEGYSAVIDFRATEAYNTGTTGKGGAEIRFWTRGNGAAGVTQAMTLQPNGGLVVPGVWNTAANGTAVHVLSDGSITKTTSSIRFKRNIRVMPGDFGDDFVMAMKPIMYNNKYGDDAGDYLGFVAEDIFDIGGTPFVSFNDGQVESLHYDKLTVPIVAALQGLIPYKARIAELEARISELERKLH